VTGTGEVDGDAKEPAGTSPIVPRTLLAVDDIPQNLKVLDAILTPRGYRLITAASGAEALQKVADEHPDLLLLDIVMPGMSGYEVCKRLREQPETRMLPIVMVTASAHEEKVAAIEAGADDFISKPVDQSELLARVKSLLRVKQYQDTITTQATELREWNRTLETRVAQQVEEVERLGRLRRFLSPQLAELILSSGNESLLQSHRREITVVFCDLRGFTAFSEVGEPEDVMNVLNAYHSAMGELIFEHDGTLKDIYGDGMMIFFNDPVPCEDPVARAVQMALAMQSRALELGRDWRRRGYDLALGIGIAHGFATMGQIGFEGRWDYGAVGSVVNLASRLCGDAKGGQILLSARAHGLVENVVEAEPVGPLQLKGFMAPVTAYSVRAIG
jgi:class 3 adenylate cyclase/CheY-like chemotaxis protein